MMNNKEYVKKVLKNADLILVDTCVLLDTASLTKLTVRLRNKDILNGKTITVPEPVIREIYKKSLASHTGIQEDERFCSFS